MLEGIIFRLRSGCQWNHLPRELGDDSTHPSDLPALGRVWGAGGHLGGPDRRMPGVGRCGLGMAVGGLLHRQSAFWGGAIGRNPTDRGKAGSKKSILVDAAGGPLSVAVAGANVHDTKLLRPTLESMVVARPPGAQNLCLDKGYDNPTGHGTVAAYQYCCAYPAHWGGEAGPMGPENLPRPTVGGGTAPWAGSQVPSDIGALRQEAGQLPGACFNWLVPSSGTAVSDASLF